MARSDAVWGIDIGQCSLKALRCRRGDREDRVVADAFDFIAYPKILSQPGADPAELIRDALGQFLSRNTVRGDRVAISVPGQNGLARFIKLPPVEAKKIPDIVRYEARQQIPFDLADVVWDYQRMGGGAEEEGFVLETEIGLFAMKREQVNRALEPFRAAGIEVDVVQLTPLALFNFLLFDQLTDRPSPEDYDPDSPPPSTVVLSLGTDATDLVVTNGFRVWQRSIPLGGNHFTRALTKELKLTFAKAEHLKCNASSAQDPKALFQAMRPVFNDLLTEIQRSIGYFQNIERHASIERIVALGGAMKMPGLRRYLSQSLGIEVVRLDGFRALSGPEVLGSPAFKDNLLSFGVAYGLAVQGLGVGRGTLTTNLLPPEIVKERFIRGKRPWAVAAAALLLLGCTIGYASLSLALGSVDEEKFKPAENEVASALGLSNELRGQYDQIKNEIDATKQIGDHLVGNVDNRVLWLELLRAVNQCLPHDPPEARPKAYDKRKEVHITSFECRRTPDLSSWYNSPEIQRWVPKNTGPAAAVTDPTAVAAPAANPSPDPYAVSAPGGDAAAVGPDGQAVAAGPTGEGWIVTLRGYTYFTEQGGYQFVRDTLLKRLQEEQISLPIGGDDGKVQKKLISLKDLGISHPVLINLGKEYRDTIIDYGASPDESEAGATAGAGGKAVPGLEDPALAGGVVPGAPGASQGKRITLNRSDFIIEFAWKPTPPRERLKQEASEAAAEQQQDPW